MLWRHRKLSKSLLEKHLELLEINFPIAVLVQGDKESVPVDRRHGSDEYCRKIGQKSSQVHLVKLVNSFLSKKPLLSVSTAWNQIIITRTTLDLSLWRPWQLYPGWSVCGERWECLLPTCCWTCSSPPSPPPPATSSRWGCSCRTQQTSLCNNTDLYDFYLGFLYLGILSWLAILESFSISFSSMERLVVCNISTTFSKST